MRIVDEDVDLKMIKAGFEKDEDLVETQEDAPLVASILDERSAELRVKQDFIESNKWKRLAQNDEISNSEVHTPGFKKSRSFNKMKANSKTTHDSDSDPSPPRRQRHDSDSDHSPPRRTRDEDSDHSPARRRHDSDSDQSPPRKRHNSDSDASPPRRRPEKDTRPVHKRNDSESDQSPPRRTRKTSDSSPPRRQRKDSDSSPPRRQVKQDSDGDLSPQRPGTSKGPGKLTKTLDGKKAGLQTGRALREEANEKRRQDEESFRKMDKTLTGENAVTNVRAGKRRLMEAEAEEKRQKEEKLAKAQEALTKWNKGVKQGEDQSKRLAEDIHEMNKPLARFAGDDDLERMLREQDRDGDPMAAYMAKKKAKSEKGKAVRQVYRGPAAAPNRFGILPGYRWDGVDRSTGFEKMYFENVNKSTALEEEAYKWSVSDM